MREWTLEERYKVLESPEQIEDLYEKIRRSVYRQKYHIQPVTGLSSDPNGFIFDGSKWHLFYQWCPWGAVHGLKYWYHVSSDDLVHWKNEGVALKPDTVYDNKGVHSGSAFLIDNSVYLYYTGNHRDQNWIRTPWTCAARLEQDGVRKLDKPLFGPRPEYTEHQRDPKIIYSQEHDSYFILIGAQTADQRGTILVYESEEPLRNWTFRGELKVEGYENFAGMWECPSIERIGDKDLLIFSPQYVKIEGRGNSTNHNIYFIGKIDFDKLVFTPDSSFEFLDYGFDFYATQLASGVDDPEHAVAIAWIGLPDNHYPTEEEDWEGSMTLPRELRIVDGKLLQTPVTGIESLRVEERPEDGLIVSPGEMEIRPTGNEFKLNLFTDGNSDGLSIEYFEDSDRVVVSKEGLRRHFNQELGETLEVPLKEKLRKLRIFLDKNSVEIFFNDGEETFTTHLYPTEDETKYRITGEHQIRIWKLEEAVEDNFVV